MLTTSAATHRGEVMMGAQEPELQIVCPDGRLSGEAPWSLIFVQGSRHYAPTLNFQ